MIRQGLNNRHWNYLLALDADAALLARFIEFVPDNYGTFSLERARLLMAASSEVDVVAKIACLKVAPDKRPKHIRDYQGILVSARPRIATYPVRIDRYGLDLTPWDSWSTGDTPQWWTAYNEVKHERHEKFQGANLRNALNALAGLFVMLIYAFPEESSQGLLAPPPSLMSIPDEAIIGWMNMGTYTTVNYRL
jgi:hypothetical protein